MPDELPVAKRMRLRYAGTCRVCGAALAAKVEAVYERSTKTVRCIDHEAADESVGGASEFTVDSGVAGASARREYERRRAKREARVREKFPRAGGLLLALSRDSQPTTAWQTGARGEEALGKGLDALASDEIRLLHDRRIPGSRANIDHLAVTTSGIYVIDAKQYRGRPDLRFEGGLLRPRTSRLVVDGRDCSKLVDGMLRQLAVVKDVVAVGVPVQGILCFVGADWSLGSKGFATGGVAILPPRRLYKALATRGGLTTDDVRTMHLVLASRLRPA